LRAWTAVSTDANAVIMMTITSGDTARMRFSSSMPSMPGSLMSSRTRWNARASSLASASLPSAALSTS